MEPAPSDLSGLLRAEIASGGPMPFRRFMEQALYHPALGYYRQAGAGQVGRRGDFYTNVSVGPLFGRLLGHQFRQMWEHLGSPSSLALIEQGAHRGLFLKDALDWARAEAPAFFAALQARVVEPSDILWQAQAETLRAAGYGAKLARCTGQPVPHAIFFSNELPDSFPVHRIVKTAGGWRESHVIWQENPGRFAWTDLPLTAPELEEAAAALDPRLPVGYVTEVNLQARSWIAEVAGRFDRGYAVTIDYGYPASLYYAPERTGGTLLCYRAHQRSADPLADPGAQDITAHVDFTALARAGAAAGLAPLGFTDQHHFLVGLLGAFPALAEPPSRALQTLLHPELMGTTFKYLVQGKGTPPLPLAGLAFARPDALG